MRLPKILVVIFLCSLISSVASLEIESTYSGKVHWNRLSGNGINNVTGTTFIKISILQMSNNSIEINIFKRMEPFGDYLDFNIEAFESNGIYDFKGLDNCKNVIEGYIKEFNEDLEFYINCIEYHEYGSSFAPLYDEKNILKKV